MSKVKIMKKTLYILFAVMCFSVTAVAENVSPDVARQVAAKFLKTQNITLVDENALASRSSRRDITSEAPAYYVFNADAERGFVIVSGDDCVGDNLVLGYAEQGNFSEDNVPDGMQWWLDATTESIARLRDLGVKATSVPLHEDVAPMVTAKWDQDYPYNILSLFYGTQCPTGCMATALAQVMYYHRWPQEPLAGELPTYTMADGNVVSALEPVAFDWNNMTDKYDESSTEEQKNAVATLMRYCGQAIQMDYKPTDSNGDYYDLGLLVNCFGYDPGVYYAKANDYTVSGWDALLYNELHEGRPLVYGGYSIGGGHAFVIDGYKVLDGEGYFSVNWGWGGSDDGFYKINLLNPSDTGTGGSTTKDGYSRGQEALIGLKPCLDASAKFYRHLNSYYWNYSKANGPAIVMVNLSYRPCSFDIALVNRNSNGTPDYSSVVFQDNVTVSGYSMGSIMNGGTEGFYYIVFTEKVCNEMFKNLASGHYDLMFVSRENVEDAPWQPVYGPNSYIEITIGADGDMTDFILHPQPQLSLTTSGINVEGLMQPGLSHAMTASFQNSSSDDFIGQVFCSAYSVEDGVLTDLAFSDETGIMIEAGGMSDINFYFSVPKEGEHVLLLTQKENKNLKGTALADITQISDYLGHELITFNTLHIVCLEAEYTEEYFEDNPVGFLEFSVGNGTPMDYDAYILFRFYRLNDSGEYDLVTFQGIPYLVKPLQIQSYKKHGDYIVLPETLEPGEYRVDMYIANDFHSHLESNYFVFDKKQLSVSTTGITSIEDGRWKMEDVWYDLQGRKFTQKPTAPGIYIYNGNVVTIN